MTNARCNAPCNGVTRSVTNGVTNGVGYGVRNGVRGCVQNQSQNQTVVKYLCSSSNSNSLHAQFSIARGKRVQKRDGGWFGC